jgi:serine/threonine-protein kinase
MQLTNGARLGSYEIIESLGAGGMGEVYRARDSRLHRDVALKIIHPDLAGPDHLARFRREARALASLCHPNVANVYEFEDVDDTAFLVMELVSGHTLEHRLAAGPLPLADVLRIAGQIAAALEAVHEKDIVHRDLKPANIKITAEGVVKVLDFGLAKTTVEDSSKSRAATATLAGTRAGIVLGTAAYMSPEQARGWDLNRRTDIWSFGCILFEMLAGHRAFAGDTQADTIAAVLEREVSWAALPPSTPAAIVRLLRRCLERDPKRRLRDIGDVRLELEDAGADRSAAMDVVPDQAKPRGRRLVLAAALLAIGAALGAVTMATRRRPPPIAQPTRFLISLPSTMQVGGLDFPSVALSPDGSMLAFVASRGGQTQLFVRRMNGLEVAALTGTANAAAPFFSPDSRWIGFFANGELKKVAISGGMPVTLCEAPVGLGGSWSSDDRIVFAATTGSGISEVSAFGGRPQRITTLDVAKGEFSHRWPQWLPDGKTILYTVGTVGSWNDASIVAQALDTGARSIVVQGGTNPQYLPSGHLLYARDGKVMRVAFNPRARTTGGSAAPLVDNVLQSSDGAAQFSVSRAGHAAYISGSFESDERRLLSVGRDGIATPLASPLAPYQTPRVSPDGQKVVVAREGSSKDLWIYDMKSASSTQLTFDAGATAPVWSADGQRVAFSSTRNGPANIFATSIAPPARYERLAPSEDQQPAAAWSPDGSTLALVERHATTGRDIVLLSLRESRTRRSFLASPVDESAPQFSPDGRWLAYVSNESGRNEVYVRALDAAERSYAVSTDGGTEPVWARSGRELFYRKGDAMMSVAFEGGKPVGRQQMLFEGGFARGTIDSANYDVLPDGQRFVMIQRQRQSEEATLHVLLNWFAEATGSAAR